MKTVGLFEAKAKLSELCAFVARGGETIVITRRGVPWVRIEPLKKSRGASEVWDASAAYRRSRRVTEELELPNRTIDPDDDTVEL